MTTITITDDISTAIQPALKAGYDVSIGFGPETITLFLARLSSPGITIYGQYDAQVHFDDRMVSCGGEYAIRDAIAAALAADAVAA